MRGNALALAGFAVVSACTFGSAPDPSVEQALAGTAGVKLSGASAQLTLTSDTDWSLTKRGLVNTAAHTVTWTVTATEGTTTSGLLVVHGTFRMTNNGSGGAPLGNIVVNLQSREDGQWVTRSSVIADATDGDAATTAQISPSGSSEGEGTFTENTASGQLVLIDATTSAPFPLAPQVTLPAGDKQTLLFSASYDNNVLDLAAGTRVRIEVIVSFGNAANSSSTTPDVDINGNGMIDADEARVRSVAARMTLRVPSSVPGNATVTLTDTADDISTTGTVTFSDPVFDLDTTGGTVTVTYDAGTSGGTITNCAHLTSETEPVMSGGSTFPGVVDLDLEACDTQMIAVRTCTPGTVGCGWEDGDVITHSHTAWGATPSATNPAGLLSARYGDVYAFGVVEMGIPGTAGFSTIFTNTVDILEYLPAIGIVGVFTSDLLDPTTTSAGEFGGHVLALTFNIDFADAGVLVGAADVALGDLTLCGLTSQPLLNGLTIRQYLAVVNTAIGGGASPYSPTVLSGLTEQLNIAFPGGTVTAWAEEHVFNGACP